MGLEVPAPSPQRSLSRRKTPDCLAPRANSTNAAGTPHSPMQAPALRVGSRGSLGAAVRITICEGPSLSSPAHMFH